jgi:hypothetical protein
MGLQEVKVPTLLRQMANTWRQGCQPYALAALYPQVITPLSKVIITVPPVSAQIVLETYHWLFKTTNYAAYTKSCYGRMKLLEASSLAFRSH